MDIRPQTHTSFIPKRPLVAGGAVPPRRMGLFTVAALLIFFGTGGYFGWTYLYARSLTADIAAMNTRIERARTEFDRAFFEGAGRLDRRIRSAKVLLDRHAAFSPLFDILEERTLENVRFRSFDFSRADDGKLKLAMKGEAKSFSAIALQAAELAAVRAFREPILADFALEQGGAVSFNFNTSLDPGVFLYRSVAAASAGAPSAEELPDTGEFLPPDEAF